MTRLPPLRAPVREGAILAFPPLEKVGELLAENQDRFSRISSELLGRPWFDLRQQARQQLLRAAQIYSEQEGAHASSEPLILAGHQPELFHPGVWIKNFALAALARSCNGVALNLLIDNDTVKSTSIPVPRRREPFPELHQVAFDRWEGEIPWEERSIHDWGTFERFGDEATSFLREWGIEPLLPPFWSEVRRQAQTRAGRLGESFAAARRELERSWGCANLELPWSRVCQGEVFAWVVASLLAELPRFLACYNGVVREHRVQHRIRSRHHPVPDLAIQGDWLEAPVWVWSVPRPRRARLFVRARPRGMELRWGEEPVLQMPSPVQQPGRFVEAWRELETRGIKLRSRALLTTLFARWFLGDLFVHGIGGAKYDELTDAMVRRFWNLDPPKFLVLSATSRLPLPHYSATVQDRQRLLHRLRELHYNPQRHLPREPSAEVQELVREKEHWVVQQPQTREGRRERFRAIRRLSQQLRPEAQTLLEQTQAELVAVEAQLRANTLLQRRDFAFCLYPEKSIRTLIDLLPLEK